ncbi:MAG TPA: ATP-binding protein [Alphaproteobacteria bacterium]|nr:ATP-binding protein [Alphaproteobacteria bacterium]
MTAGKRPLRLAILGDPDGALGPAVEASMPLGLDLDWTLITSLEALRVTLQRGCDAVLYDPAAFSAASDAVLAEIRGQERRIPVILLSDGSLGEERVAALMSLGASGLVLRHKPDRLGAALADALKRSPPERRLGLAEAQLLEALDAISEGFVLFDRDDRLVLCNDKYRRLNPEIANLIEPGVRFEELVRRELELGLYLDAIGREEQWLAARLHMHRAPTATFERQHIDGRWTLVRERRTRDGGSVGIRVDITALKEREQELRQAKEAAEMASRAKSDFLSNMSHELRTPLNAIIGFSEIMRRELFGPVGHGNYAEYVRNIHESGKHLLALIGDILDLSKIEAGRFTLAEAEVDIAEIIRSSVELMEEKARSAELSLAVDMPEPLPLLVGEERALRQILLNLLSNAIKFTHPGGSVTMRSALDRSGEIVIAVADTGVGIAPEDLPRAMEPFGQIETSLARRHQGTGLGLPLAKKLVEAHGGAFVIESAPGRGTVVTARFPTARVLGRRSAATA